MAAWSSASQGWLGSPQPPPQPDGQLPEMEAQEMFPQQLHASRAHTNGIPFKKPCFLGPDFYSCSLTFFLKCKQNACCQQDQIGIPERTSALGKVGRLLLLPSAQPVPCQASTLEKLVLWKEAQPGRVPDSFLQHSIKCPDAFLSCICIKSVPGHHCNT